MQVLKEIFRKMCLSRYFESCMFSVKDKIKCPVYLSYGQEAIAASFGVLLPKATVFPQHRGHSWFLSFGGSPEKLRDEILGRTTGCCKGMGGSSDTQCVQVKAHNGLLGENIPLGVGYTFASGTKTIIPFGDSAIEEDYAHPGLGFAATHKLPCYFVSEDNGLAILTPISDRRSWKSVDLANGYGIPSLDIEDDPLEIISAFHRAKPPVLFNIKTIRHYWHVGFGQDGIPSFDRFYDFKRYIDGADKIERDTKKEMEALWRV